MHNFGILQSVEIAVFTFVFTNVGNKNLWINNADGGCGCIKTSSTKKPIKPGMKGEIEVKFNTSGMFGSQIKTITVDANVSKPKHLTIFAEVKNEQIDIKY
jgi:hypothetical protein